MEELKLVVSTPFKKNLGSFPFGERILSFLWLLTSNEFSPKIALAVKDRALEVGLLTFRSGALIPAFDVESVRIPHAFKPPENFLESYESFGAKILFSKERFPLSKFWSLFPQIRE